MKISAVEKLEASAVFSGSAGFAIPPYQRAYKWDVEQTKTLVVDLLRAMDQYAVDRRPEEKFFLGTLLIRQPPHTGHHEVIRREIVDGQQRLVTLYLVIAAIYELSGDGGYLGALYTNPITGVLRIELRSPPGSSIPAGNTHTNGVFLEQFLRNQSGNAQAAIIRANYDAIKGVLAPLSPKELKRFGIFIMDEVQFVRVLVGSVEDAYGAFEVLNSRNTPVSLNELVRSYLLTKGGREAEAAWQRVETLSRQIGRGKPQEIQEAQDAFVSLILEHAWLLTFGKYLTSSASSTGALVRLQFTQAREDLCSSDTVTKLCVCIYDIADSVFCLFPQKEPNAKESTSRGDWDAIEAMKTTSTYARSGQSVLVALNARLPMIPEHVTLRLATVTIRAHVQNIQRKGPEKPIKLSEYMEAAARNFFEPSGEHLEIAERVMKYAWTKELYRDDEFVEAFRAYYTPNEHVARYLLLAIERKIAPDYRHTMPLRAVQRYKQDKIEQALVEQERSTGRTNTDFHARRTRAYELSVLLGNWILQKTSDPKPQNFLTHYMFDGNVQEDPVHAIIARQELLAQDALKVWPINAAPHTTPGLGSLRRGHPPVFR